MLMIDYSTRIVTISSPFYQFLTYHNHVPVEKGDHLIMVPAFSQYRASYSEGFYYLLDMEELKIMKVGVGIREVLNDHDIISLMRRIVRLLGIDVRYGENYIYLGRRARVFKCPLMSVYALVFGTFRLVVEPLDVTDRISLLDLPVLVQYGPYMVYIDEGRIIPIPDNSNIYHIVKIGKIDINYIGLDSTFRVYNHCRLIRSHDVIILRTWRRDIVKLLSGYVCRIVNIGDQYFLYFNKDIDVERIVQSASAGHIADKIDLL
ncbi:MAG: hypothetical protein GXO26_08270 [Crenarchaeota archaeon]|nr:hypothetical protein [Thermoproteota archaeon]